MTQDKDESDTNNKTENKTAEGEVSNAVFLLQTNEKTKGVEGTSLNFAAKASKEEPEAPKVPKVPEVPANSESTPPPSSTDSDD